MNSSDEIVSFMDLLDLDEDIIDARLKSIIGKTLHSNKQLASVVYLLQYKLLINIQEGTECDTEEECNFVAKLVNEVHEGNIEIVCKIINTVLQLNPSSIVRVSEHLFQQILGNVGSINKGMYGDTIEEENSSKTLLSLKLCDSILDAVLKNGQKLELNFFDFPIKSILSSADAKVKGHFLANTVPRLFERTTGYNVLDKIWEYLKEIPLEENKENILKALSCLSEFYLPVPDTKGEVKFESNLVFQYEFWRVTLFGLQSNDPTMRKISLYLAKRAIDCLIALKKDVSIRTETDPVFLWQQNGKINLKKSWDNFFILMDSLEEKQSNIVLPSLQLFNELDGVEHCWINCAFHIGLKHENAQVRLKCVNYKLRHKLHSEEEAMLLLEALNDINLYDNPIDCQQLDHKLSTVLEDVNTFNYILKAIPKLKWSPVPLFYVTKVVSSIQQKKILMVTKPAQLTEMVIKILKVPCNNIAVRKAVKLHVAFFLTNSCRSIGWIELLKIYPIFDWNMFTFGKNFYNPFFSLIRHIYLNEDERQEFFKMIASSYHNIDFGLTYLEDHDNDITVLLNMVHQKMKKIQDIINRQYSDKTECFSEFLFLTCLHEKTSKRDTASKEFINEMVSREHKMFIQYISFILCNNINLTMDERTLFFNGLGSILAVNKSDTKEHVLELYKSAILVIKDTNSDLYSRVTAVFILNGLKSNIVLTTSHNNEMLDVKKTTQLINEIKFKDTQNMDNDGRMRNVVYEKLCEIMFYSLKAEQGQNYLYKLIECIEKLIECGGYGCLKWILKIVNIILPLILNEEDIKFDITQFIHRMWQETEELKSNNQYTICFEEFINLISHEVLIKKALFSNTVILYGSKIIEYGQLKNIPLFYLAKKFNSIDITDEMGHLVFLLIQMLLHSPVPRKDQRIADNLVVQIIEDQANYGFEKHGIDFHSTFEIQLLSVSTLCKITNPEILETVISLLVEKIEEVFNKKQRYHGNSQTHRTLLFSLQHLLLIVLLNPKIVDSEKYLTWSLDFLENLPHQPSVRICLEWFIALHFYIKKVHLNEDLIVTLNAKNIPIASQLMILYWVLKHKIATGKYKSVEYECVMDMLLSHTMGPLFNTRLMSQFLATKLFAISTQHHDKYDYIIQVINKTFIESSKDKNFVKLMQDFFVNDFDIVSHLTPCFIYYFLPRYCDISSNEYVDERLVKNILEDINECILVQSTDSDFTQEWMSSCKKDAEVFDYKLLTHENKEVSQSGEVAGTIQKKYIPWKNMSDIEVYESSKKKGSASELIVVASLIDKLPNLGGMARTSEVFGVNTYVIDSLRHLQDKMFQGLSVSAERWVNIEEVRPGAPLKEYLNKKKAEGYSMVAAEQTSTSTQLQTFKFPSKSLLLLGHEKEGIPCDLLPMMDHCVEIPQQGFLRSLNVHVTAAIFVWEYTRQLLL